MGWDAEDPTSNDVLSETALSNQGTLLSLSRAQERGRSGLHYLPLFSKLRTQISLLSKRGARRRTPYEAGPKNTITLMQTLGGDLICQQDVRQGAPSDVYSKQIPGARPRPSLAQDVNHSKQIPDARPHPSLQQDVNPNPAGRIRGDHGSL